MDDYMLLIRDHGYKDLSPEEMQNTMTAFRAWAEKMTQAGRHKGGAPLEPAGGRVVTGGAVPTDGPFLESKEMVGGYLLVAAADIEEAVAFARECPLSAHCDLEVRKLGRM